MCFKFISRISCVVKKDVIWVDIVFLLFIGFLFNRKSKYYKKGIVVIYYL